MDRLIILLAILSIRGGCGWILLQPILSNANMNCRRAYNYDVILYFGVIVGILIAIMLI